MLYELPLAAAATLSGLAVMVRDLDAMLRAPDHVPGAAFALGPVLIGVGVFISASVLVDLRSRALRSLLLTFVLAAALTLLALGISAAGRASGVWGVVLGVCGATPLVGFGLAARPWPRSTR